MYQVYQHWDQLKVCLVGRAYNPEQFAWIKNTKTRSYFEQLAIETEEDFQDLINKLHFFDVQTLRPNLPLDLYAKPPVAVRDHCVMIGNTFYSDIETYDFNYFFYNVREENGPWLDSADQLEDARLIELHEQYKTKLYNNGYQHILQEIKDQGNKIKTFVDPHLTGPMVTRIGRDLYVGTYEENGDYSYLRDKLDKEFPNYRVHVIDTGGHSDGTFCPVTPGLIISHWDMPTYQDSFPDWEVLYLPKPEPTFQGKKWWMPGAETKDVVDTVEKYMNGWVGNITETVFDVNMLIINQNNVIMIAHNETVIDKLAEYGVTAHVVPFRHRWFWDGGIHCITNDLHREGTMQDYFPGRSK
jgi:hypothetical protein